MFGTPLEVIETELRDRARHLMTAVNRSRDRFGKEWERDCNLVFGHAFQSERELRSAVRGYLAFANQAMRHQAAYQQSGKYQNSTFEAVSGRVYFDANYMSERYLPGLLLSHLLWPHHYAQLTFYRKTIDSLSPRTFSEIGLGTGLYSFFTLLRFPDTRGLGVDLSETAIRFASNLLSRRDLRDRYSVSRCDITKSSLPASSDLLLSVELLEHLEDPTAFLKAVRRHIGASGSAFVTAAINAAHDDHIYLYKSAGNVELQLEQSGLEVVSSYFENAYEPRSRDELVPAVAAYYVKQSSSRLQIDAE